MEHALTTERERVLHDVVLERAYQGSRYSTEHDRTVPPLAWAAILTKHLGRAASEAVTNGATGALRHHLIRVAAVCVAAVEAMDWHAARGKR